MKTAKTDKGSDSLKNESNFEKKNYFLNNLIDKQ